MGSSRAAGPFFAKSADNEMLFTGVFEELHFSRASGLRKTALQIRSLKSVDYTRCRAARNRLGTRPAV
jgi:hypothetical protein